jgi:hypothetical protein
MNPRLQQLATFKKKKKRLFKGRLGHRLLGDKTGIAGIATKRNAQRALIGGLAGIGAYKAVVAPTLNYAYQKAVYPYTPGFRFSRLQKLATFSKRGKKRLIRKRLGHRLLGDRPSIRIGKGKGRDYGKVLGRTAVGGLAGVGVYHLGDELRRRSGGSRG